MNEYRVPEINVQNGVLKSLSFLFEYIGEMGKDYIYAVTPLLEDALRVVCNHETASVSLLQRRLRVGYTRAGRLIDMLERRGAISGYEGSKPRQVLIAEGDIPRIMGGGGGAVATAPADDEPPFAHDGD